MNYTTENLQLKISQPDNSSCHHVDPTNSIGALLRHEFKRVATLPS